MIKMPSVFHYINFRHFLRDYYLEKKKQSKGFSYRVFNRSAKIVSPTFFKLVCENKRNLSGASILSFARALNLNKTETRYFKSLVYFNQSENFEEKKYHFHALCCFKEHNDIKELQTDQLRFYTQWYNSAVLEMTNLKNFREDPAWIAKRLFPTITEKQAKESLELLKKLGLVKYNPQKRLVTTNKNITTSKEVADMVVVNYHENMIDLAKKSLSHTAGSFRDVSSVTVALDKKSFLEAKRRIQEFRRELNVLLSQTKNPDHVYQINFQIFNLTGILWKDI